MSTRVRPPASGAATFRRSFLATATAALTAFSMISLAALAHASTVDVTSVADVTAPNGVERSQAVAEQPRMIVPLHDGQRVR